MVRRLLVLFVVASTASCTLLFAVDEVTGGRGAAPSDGDAPAAADAADAGVTFCQQDAHALCFDFDDGRRIPEGTSPFEEAKGAIALTMFHFRSAPFALASRLPGDDAGTRPRAVLLVPLPGPLRRTRVEADILLSSHSSTAGSLGMVALHQSGTPDSTSIFFSGNLSGMSSISVSTYAPAYDTRLKGVSLQTGLFYHLTFVVEPTPGAANISLTVGPYDVQLNGIPLVLPTAPGPVMLHLGLRANNAESPEANAVYDNVTVSFD